MQADGVVEYRGVDHCGMVPRRLATRPAVPLLARLIGKFVIDIMPAALASAIGGFLLTQYQLGHPALPPAEPATVASTEMMALVRDEHALITDYLKAELAAEKARAASAPPAAQAAERPAPARRGLELSTNHAVTLAAKPSQQQAKPAPTATATPGAPLVIAPTENAPMPATRAPSSMLAKTLDIKDHLVAATRHVVFLIGDALGLVDERRSGVARDGHSFSAES